MDSLHRNRRVFIFLWKDHRYCVMVIGRKRIIPTENRGLMRGCSLWQPTWLFSRPAAAEQRSVALKCLQRVTQAGNGQLRPPLWWQIQSHTTTTRYRQALRPFHQSDGFLKNCKSGFSLFRVVCFLRGSACSTVAVQHQCARSITCSKGQRQRRFAAGCFVCWEVGSSPDSSGGVLEQKAPTDLICSSSNRIAMFWIIFLIKGGNKKSLRFSPPFSPCLVGNGGPSEAFPLVAPQKKSRFGRVFLLH